ncbi:helix-turn-helix transcriptional regulator [Novosphingobium sp. P6W]|uniref:ArsR/SmtB family transcription factor n=1 Tax=Novosphingobium sp. P6W TaxID=1609758 RepID=UPI0013B3B944|nr:helix-turn-helix domain-containing protein [Novosphingobium sp. P6W]
MRDWTLNMPTAGNADQPVTSFKAKTVRRTIRALEYLASGERQATVMDLVRSLDVPQSSMSELLSALVDAGVLTRDSNLKYYRAAPRLAAIGLATQPGGIAAGTLFRIMDDLSHSTRLPIGLFGINRLHVQVQRLSVPPIDRECDAQLASGPQIDPLRVDAESSIHLSLSEIGLLLLSALGSGQSDKVLWRLLAEVPPGQKFDYGDACRKVRDIQAVSSSTGPAGFAPGWKATAVLLPAGIASQPLALAALYPGALAPDRAKLVSMLRESVRAIPGAQTEPEPELAESVAA